MKDQKTLLQIISYIDSIMSYTKDVTYQEFIGNKMMVEACVFNLSQIGELVNRIDKEFIDKNHNVPWLEMRGLRNRLIHDYEGVNFILVWEVISTDLITLRNQLTSLLK